MQVRPKKHLGQHFLKDENIAAKIARSLTGNGYNQVLEIGPGTGMLTRHLLADERFETWVVEIDTESVAYLKEHYPGLRPRILEEDFLTMPLDRHFRGQVAITGNFPYNISSQIAFRVLEYRHLVPEFTGMFQREVAQRFAATGNSKDYGILSVLLQAFYDVKYLFTVSEHVFNPPPKVKSGVVQLIRKEDFTLPCSEKLFFDVVKTAFNQRRKTLRNSLHKFAEQMPAEFSSLRPEQLDVKAFTELTRLIEQKL